MGMRKYSVWVLVVLLLSVTIVSGCGSGKKEEAATGSSSSSASAKEENVELVFWTYPTSGEKAEDLFGRLIDNFQKKYSNVKVKLEVIPYEGGEQKINVALASNTTPDILNDYPGRTTGYAQRGYTVPLNDLFTAEQLKKIPKDILQMVSLPDGSIFSYPQGLTATLLVINKTLVAKAGATDLLPKGEMRTWTFDQFEKLLRAVKNYQKDDYPFTMFALNEQGDMLYHSFMTGFGGKKFSDDRKTSVMNAKESVQAIEWVKKLVDNKLVYPNPETRSAAMSNEYFIQGKTAVALGSLGSIQNVEKAKADGTIKGEFDTMLAPFPSVKEDHGVIVPGGGMFVAFNNKDQKKIEYSKKFIDFLLNENTDLLKTTKVFDVYGRDTLGANPNPEELWLSKLITETKRISGTDLAYDIYGYSQTRAVFFPEMQSVFIGAKTPQKAMDDYVAKANKIIQDAAAAAAKR